MPSERLPAPARLISPERGRRQLPSDRLPPSTARAATDHRFRDRPLLRPLRLHAAAAPDEAPAMTVSRVANLRRCSGLLGPPTRQRPVARTLQFRPSEAVPRLPS